MVSVVIILCYLALVLGLGLFSAKHFKGTSSDFFVASRGIGPFLLLMSLFGTTMTAFALVGSTGESFKSGIGVYGKLASSSGIVHSLCFFLVGVKLWALGKKHGYLTQIQFFRDRFDSDAIGLILFPAIVGLVIPYLLIGVMSSGTVVQSITTGAFPIVFAATEGGVPYWLGAGVICVVVLTYVFLGGVRGTAWANAFQTLVFIALGIITFAVITNKFGGLKNATQMVIDQNPSKLQRSVHPDDLARYEAQVEASAASTEVAEVSAPKKPEGISKLVFFTYMLIPLSVGMFPHVFQHWLTAKSSNSFKLAVVAHPLLIMIVWAPCVLIGTWATSAMINGEPVIPPGFSNPNAVLPYLVGKLTTPVLGGLLSAGILAAIMSSLDSQFLSIGSIFTNDIVTHYYGKDRFSDRQKLLIGRGFVILVVLVCYLIAIKLEGTRGVFTLGIWCFSGYSGLFPILLAALYWKRTTTPGAFAAIIATMITWLALFAQSGYGANRGYLFLGMMPVATMVIVSSLALVSVSLATKPPSEKTLNKFFPKSGNA
jgi:SSS family solute:Na+ symporter